MDAFQDIGRVTDPSLQDLVDEAARRALLPAGQLARARSAVAALSSFLRRPASEIPGHQGFVIAQMKRMRKAPSKLAKKTLSNYRTELCALIRATRGRGPKSPQPHSATWQSLRAQLKNSADWAALSRLAGFASSQKVTPAEVDDAFVEMFIAELETLGEVSDAEGHGRRLRRQWNRLGATNLEFGRTELKVEAQARVRWTFRETDFDVRLIRDIEAYLVWLADDDPLSGNPGCGLRPTTLKTIRHQVFKAASALVQSGRSIETISTLSDLVSLESLNALMRVLYERQQSERSNALHRLAGSLLCIARDWVRVDEQEVAALKRRVSNFAPKRELLGKKTRERLAPFEDEDLLDQLLSLPIRLLEEAKAAKNPRVRGMLAQSAIACEILIYAPLRIENLTALHVDRSLERQRDRWLIRLPGSEVKNGEDQCFTIPAEAVARIRAAMRLYTQVNGSLFPGKSGGPKLAGSLSSQIKRTVEQRLGVAFHPHLYRSIAIYLQVRSGGVAGLERGRVLLGNRDAETIRRNYSYLADREHLKQAQMEIAKQQHAVLKRRR